MRTSALGSLVVACRVGSRSLVKRKWPRWLVPSWISKPSCVWLRGTAMMPAFSIRMSRRCDSDLNLSAAALIEAKEVRSRGR